MKITPLSATAADGAALLQPTRTPPMSTAISAQVGVTGTAEGSRAASWTHLRTALAFPGFDHYENHAPGLPTRLVLKESGPFSATVRRVRGAGLLAVVARTSLANTVHAMTPDREVFAFTGASAERSFTVNGVGYTSRNMLWIPGAAEIFCKDPGEVDAWSYSFAREEFQAAVEALHGSPMLVGRTARLLTPPPDVLSPLRRALAIAMRGPGPVERGLVTAILHGTVAALPPGPLPAERLSRTRQFDLVEGFLALAEANTGLSTMEACRILATPLRTLNASANAVLGMGAAQYLRRRRLHAARAALRTGTVGGVTQAATENGFWELSRFTTDYRALFGERPSDTLRAAGRAG